MPFETFNTVCDFALPWCSSPGAILRYFIPHNQEMVPKDKPWEDVFSGLKRQFFVSRTRRAMTMAWISPAPSKMLRIRAS